ncbi:hypothetical protein ABE099_08785 [Paenibacillus turicensis]|uniref:hypothetical protein n=1 Tax=Paenibacillus turicensis TaxID=160487 RepID=UPI003D29CDCE
MAYISTETAVPKMTSNTAPNGRAFASSGAADAWRAFDRIGTAWSSASGSGGIGYLGYEFLNKIIIKKYSIKQIGSSNVSNRVPRTWTFEGSNDGANWTVLDTQVNQNWKDFTPETKEYIINESNKDYFKIYRLNYTSNGGSSISHVEELELFELIPDKRSLIHHNSTYKHYTNNQWHSLPSPPTEQDYLDYGMDDLSIIPESAWQELEGDVELCYYTDDPNKSEASFNITTTPFTLAEEWEDKTISVIEYTDDPNQTESSITLETEPFTIYDELGDEVDVLYYTDDPDKNEAKLNITANYSPLDELEGDFDVVTYSEDLSEGDTLALNVEALPLGQLVITPQSFAYLGEIRGFISHLINSNNVGIIRFIISFDDGATWKSYSKGLDQWKNVNIISSQNVIKDGMRYQTFNAIPEHQIKAQPNGNIKLAYYIEETKHLNQPIGIDYISYRSLVPQEDIKFNDVAFYVLNTTATIDLQFGGNKLTGTLSDEDLTKVQYRVLLNGEPYYPISGEFTRLNAPPVNISLNINERDIIFEKENLIRVEFKDSWGETDFWEPPPFIGTYSGIMFKDEKGKYLSNSFGEILRNLEFGDIIAGQTTLEQKVIVKNQMGVQVQNLILNVMKDKLPEGVGIELSRTNNPFVAEDPLLFNMFFNPDDEFTLYVRISTDLEAPANPNGEFEVRANADPV